MTCWRENFSSSLHSFLISQLSIQSPNSLISCYQPASLFSLSLSLFSASLLSFALPLFFSFSTSSSRVLCLSGRVAPTRRCAWISFSLSLSSPLHPPAGATPTLQPVLPPFSLPHILSFPMNTPFVHLLTSNHLISPSAGCRCDCSLKLTKRS